MTHFTAEDVHEQLDLYQALDIWVCISGGWGVDALLEEQTRDHGDLDIVVQQRDLVALRTALELRGYEEIWTVDQSSRNFVLQDAEGRKIDLHVIEITPDGTGLYGEDGWSFPAESLIGHGVIGGRPVVCHPPQMQVDFHSDYDLKPNDIADVRALREAFNVELPPELS